MAFTCQKRVVELPVGVDMGARGGDCMDLLWVERCSLKMQWGGPVCGAGEIGRRQTTCKIFGIQNHNFLLLSNENSK